MLELPSNRPLTRENVEECLEFLETLEGTKLSLGIRWKGRLHRLREALESGNVTDADEQLFAEILREMEHEGGLLEFRNNLAASQMGPGYAEVHDLQTKLPEMTVEDVRLRLADVMTKLRQAATEMDAAIEAAAENFLRGQPMESFDTVAALRMAHLDLLRQILVSALRAKSSRKPPSSGAE